MTDIHDLVEKDSRYGGSCNCEIDDACNVILLDLVDQARKEGIEEGRKQMQIEIMRDAGVAYVNWNEEAK